MDHPRINCLILNSVSFIIGGAFVCIFTFFDDYTTLMLIGCIIGFMVATYPVCLSIAIGQMVPTEKFASVAGKISFGMGLASIFGPVLGGYIFDSTKDIKMILFYVAAAFFLTAICSFISGIIHNRRQKKGHGVLDVEI